MTNSDNLIDPDALEDVSDEKIEEKLLDRPINSIRDLQYTYGALTTLAVAGSGDYAEYYTPEAAHQLIDEPQSLISVRVDVTGEDPEFAGVNVREYTSDVVERVGFSHYPTGQGTDHSVTHRSGKGNEPYRLANHAVDRLADWPMKEPVQRVKEQHENGDLIQALETLGKDEDVVEAIRDEVTEKVEESRTSLLSVEILRDEDQGWEYPGEVEVFNEGLREKKLNKLVTKGDAEDARGPAVDYVTGEEETVVGTMEDPFLFYKTRQLEKFPGFDIDAAWTSNSISEDTAIAIAKSSMLFDQLSESVYGAEVYYIPYLTGEWDADDARLMFNLLAKANTNSGRDGTDDPIVGMYKTVEQSPFPDERLRFYLTVSQYNGNGSRKWVGHENPESEFMAAVDVSEAHRSVLDSWLFHKFGDSKSGVFTTEASEEYKKEDDPRTLLDPDDEHVDEIVYGSYVEKTLPTPDSKEQTIAHSGQRTFANIVSGNPVKVEELLDGFISELCNTGIDAFSSYWNNLIAAQWVQLSALASEGQLTTNRDSLQPFTEPPKYMTEENDTSRPETREQMLEQFIEEHPPLRESTERRSAFLLGALIGHISNYQDNKQQVNQTMAKNNPAGALTKTNFQQKVTTAVEKSRTYASKDGDYSGPMLFREVIERLVDDVQKSEINEWSLSRQDLRFHYGLGVAYGQSQYIDTTDA